MSPSPDGEWIGRVSDITRAAPLLILGLDSGDPRLLRRWADEGYMPTLSALMKRGCWAETSSRELMFEHGAWLSIFSGISRASHGYYYFRQLLHGSYDLRLTYGPEIKSLPFWSRLRSDGKRAVVIDVHDAPLIRGMPGVQVANWAIHRGYVSRAAVDQPQTEPPGLLEEITSRFGPPQQIIEEPDADAAENRRLLRDLLARVERKGALCRYLIDREPADLVVACFGESHTAGHQFWRYCAEVSAHRPPNGHEFRCATRDVYQAIDRQMGQLLEQMPASTNVFVLSSIGLADHCPTGALMEAFCRSFGYQPRPESPRRSLKPTAIVRRIFPEWLRIALSRRFSRETREKIFSQQFRNGTNWQKTRVFAIPSIYSGFLRVNLRGREPQGTVEPGQEYEALLERLETELFQLVDPKTGQPAVEKVVRTNELYDCNYPAVLPDLIVHWKPCPHFIDRLVHPSGELVQKRPEFFRDSEHMDRGFFAAAGPAIQSRGHLPDVDVLDLAPTFLALLKEEKPQEMTGDIIKDLIKPGSPAPSH